LSARTFGTRPASAEIVAPLQEQILKFFTPGVDETATLATAMFFYETGTALRLVQQAPFRNMIESIRKAPMTWKLPSVNALRTTQLEKVG
jgi:hypothetical protein